MIEINDNEPMLTQHEVSEYIAKMLKVSARAVYDRWVHFPGFPKAKLLPTMGKKPVKRYNRDEIIAWTEKQKKAA